MGMLSSTSHPHPHPPCTQLHLDVFTLRPSAVHLTLCSVRSVPFDCIVNCLGQSGSSFSPPSSAPGCDTISPLSHYSPGIVSIVRARSKDRHLKCKCLSGKLFEMAGKAPIDIVSNVHTIGYTLLCVYGGVFFHLHY